MQKDLKKRHDKVGNHHDMTIESVEESSSSSDDESQSRKALRGSFWDATTDSSSTKSGIQKGRVIHNTTANSNTNDTNTRRKSSFAEAFMGHVNPKDPPAFSSPPAQNNNNNPTVVSTENERQILLLMLLAQVCALHDPTPRTFTVHVLELFERGILDRESIRFLFDYGLVPSLPLSPSSTTVPTTPTNTNTTRNVQQTNKTHNTATTPTKSTQAVVPYRPTLPESPMDDYNHALRRSEEASAIRSHLEFHHSTSGSSLENSHPKSPTSLQRTLPAATSSWAAKHFPLSLSRYTREFHQVQLLASGSFGQVYCATRHMDGKKYAVKKVIFSASGYSNESVTKVVREVHCLAQCNHDHCVRYYTSWLEPSWMTGQASSIQEEQLLTDMERVVLNHDDPSTVIQSSSPRAKPKRRFSFDNVGWSEDEIFQSYDNDDSDYSEWTQDAIHKHQNDWGRQYSMDDSCIHPKKNAPHKAKQSSPKQQTYKYQICLYIQMELCGNVTLADWIQNRNANVKPTLRQRAGPALEIFRQICSGISHVHSQHILHRDLKPANIFASLDSDKLHFKIGDFGLSKLLHGKHQEFPPHKQEETTTSSSASASLALVKKNKKPHLPIPPLFAKQQQDARLLTAGVGTASYAAPEQLESRQYGPHADVFSMGLLLLELFCCFDTQHERFHTFYDCRNGKLPLQLEQQYPHVASTVLACCHKSPSCRPTARELLDSDKLWQSNNNETTDKATREQTLAQVVQGLETKLKEKDAKIHKQQAVIAEKDRMIEELRQQVSIMMQNGGPRDNSRLVQTTSRDSKAGHVEASVSSFSDDDDDDDY